MRRRSLGLISLSVITMTLLASGHADAADSAGVEHRLVALVNHERAPRGLQSVHDAGDLRDIALRQAKRMAGAGRIYHNPNLATEVQHYLVTGENVAVGQAPDAVHAAFMASPVHRAEILEPRYSEVGVGVYFDGRYLWVSEVFRQPDGSAAQPAPAPAPAAAAMASAPSPAPAAPTAAAPAPPRPTSTAARPSTPAQPASTPASTPSAPVATTATPAAGAPSRTPVVFAALGSVRDAAMLGHPAHHPATRPVPSGHTRRVPGPTHTATAAILIVGWFALWRRLRPARR